MRHFLPAGRGRRRRAVITFKQRTHAAPASDGALAAELAERQLHVEQRYAAHDQHHAVGQKERACKQMGCSGGGRARGTADGAHKDRR